MDEERLLKSIEERDASGSKVLRCNICSSQLVSIRSRYPGSEGRLVCACCLQERMEHSHEMSSPQYGQATQARKP